MYLEPDGLFLSEVCWRSSATGGVSFTEGGMKRRRFPSIPQCVIGSEVQLLPRQIQHMSL